MANQGKSAKVVEPASAEGDSKWYKGLEKVQSYFDHPFRDKWKNKVEFVLSCVGYCIGFGNIWRYPYVVYENGGSAFLFPYLVIVLVLALPLFFLETLLGQFSGCNPVSAFNFAPICRGIGIGMVIVNFYIIIYYIMFMAYSTRYLFASFNFELPWSKCMEEWGADVLCFDPTTEKDENATTLPDCAQLNATLKKNYTVTVDCNEWVWPAEEFWHKGVLKDEGGSLGNIGEVHWDLLLLLLLSWIIQYLVLLRGIKTSGKIVYITAIFPFIILIIMFIYTLTLEGATDGLSYLFQVSDWSKMFSASVWRAAITQAFFSTGIAFGCLILYSSYNEFTYNLQIICIIIIILDLIASLLSAMTVFSVLGYLAYQVERDITEVVAQGPALIFITMPQAIATMPVSHLWSVLYFLMLYAVGIDSQVQTWKSTDNMLSSLVLNKHTYGNSGTLHMGGFYVVSFLEIFSSENTLIFLALCEVIVIMYLYGIKHFDCDIAYMTGKTIFIYWKLCWLGVVPVMLIGKAGYSMQPVPTWGPRQPLYKIGYLDWINQVQPGTQPEKSGQTGKAMKELEADVSEESPTVQAVATRRVVDQRFSIFRRFSSAVFHPGEIEFMEHRMGTAGSSK
uniref:Sodium-dependent nutrient amino acid transporter 1 n=1 Tax=Strigamia maritima TaxID=126957 RepID=T1JF95_STRMM